MPATNDGYVQRLLSWQRKNREKWLIDRANKHGAEKRNPANIALKGAHGLHIKTVPMQNLKCSPSYHKSSSCLMINTGMMLSRYVIG
jgi:hypothetical protein